MWRELLRPPTGSHPKTKGWGGAAASKDGTEGSVTRTEANGMVMQSSDTVKATGFYSGVLGREIVCGRNGGRAQGGAGC